VTATVQAARVAEPCAHCGRPVPGASTSASAALTQGVVGHLHTTLVVYCSTACRDLHLVALALASPTCAAPGCDLDPAADLPFCDGHLDPAAESDPTAPGHRSGHAA